MPTETALPLTIEIAKLPVGFSGTPQELSDAIAERVRIVAQQSFALFLAGSVEPTSDQGPWAENGNTWKYFDLDTGSYQPFLIPADRLGYQVSVEEPTNEAIVFWFQIDTAGNPLALKLRVVTGSGSDWISIYYLRSETYTKTEIDAIAAGVVQPGGVFAQKNASQNITGNGTRDKILYAQALFGAFDTVNSRFVAPANGLYEFAIKLNWQVSAGSPTGIRFVGEFRTNGMTGADYALAETEETGTQNHIFAQTLVLTAGDYVEFFLEVNDTGSATYLLAAGVNQYSVKRIG